MPNLPTDEPGAAGESPRRSNGSENGDAVSNVGDTQLLDKDVKSEAANEEPVPLNHGEYNMMASGSVKQIDGANFNIASIIAEV